MNSTRVKEWRKIKFDKGTAYWRYKRIFDNVKGRTVLDVGTGNGYITYELSKDHELTTIDLSKKAISSLRENLGALGLKASLINDDFLKHDFKHRFDTVILAEFIEHFNESDAKRIIKKAYKLADKTIIISTPNRELVVQSEPTHVNEYNLDEFKELLADYHPIIQGTVIAGEPNKEGFELAKDEPSKSRTFVALINKGEAPKREGYFDSLMSEVLNYYKKMEPLFNDYVFSKGRLVRLLTFQRLVESLKRVDFRSRRFVRRKAFKKFISSARNWADIYSAMAERNAFDLNISTNAYKNVEIASLIKKTHCQVISKGYYTYFNCIECSNNKCRTNLIPSESFVFIDVDSKPESIMADCTVVMGLLKKAGLSCAYKFSSDSGIHLKIPLSSLTKEGLTVFSKAIIQYCVGMAVKGLLKGLPVRVDDSIFVDPNQSVRMPFALHYKKLLPSIPFDESTINEAYEILLKIKSEPGVVNRLRIAADLLNDWHVKWDVFADNSSFLKRALKQYGSEARSKILRMRLVKTKPTTPVWVRRLLLKRERTSLELSKLKSYFKLKGLSSQGINKIIK